MHSVKTLRSVWSIKLRFRRVNLKLLVYYLGYSSCNADGTGHELVDLCIHMCDGLS